MKVLTFVALIDGLRAGPADGQRPSDDAGFARIGPLMIQFSE